MSELGSADPFYVTMALWLAKTGILVLVSGFLAWLGIRALDALTPLHERQRIGDSPIATALFMAGFLILIGLVILLLSLGLIKIGSDSGSEVAQIGIKLLGFIGGFIGSSLLYAWVILLGVCINLLPLFGIVWIGSFFMESLKDHVMYWPNFWGSF